MGWVALVLPCFSCKTDADADADAYMFVYIHIYITSIGEWKS